MEYGWSLIKSNWKTLMELLQEYEIEWKKYPLEKAYKKSIPKKTSGVYMLCLPPMECKNWFFGEGALNIFNAIYIGRSIDLQRRFNEYLRRSNISPRIKDFLQNQHNGEITFGFAVCDLSKIQRVEGALIKCFGPSANARGEDGPSCRARINEARDI